MTGSATLTGRFSVAVVTTLPESKVRVPEVFITLSSVTAVALLPVPDCASKLPVMSVGQRNWPIRPVIRRIASPCVEPAARLPPVHARKRAVLSEILNRITEIHHDREIDRCRHDGHRVTVDRIAPGEIEQNSPVHSYPICCNVLESVSCGLKITSNHGRSNI